MMTIFMIGLFVAAILGIIVVVLGGYYLVYVPLYYTYKFLLKRINDATSKDCIGGFVLKSVLLLIPIVVFMLFYIPLTWIGSLIGIIATIVAFTRATYEK